MKQTGQYKEERPQLRGGRGESVKGRKKTVAKRTEIVIKSKRNILKKYSPRTLPMKDFFI